MTGFFRGLSLVSRGLRYKLIVAFCLMSIIPLLTFMVIITYYFVPTVTTLRDVAFIIAIAILIAVMGFYLAKKIIDPIIEMASDAKNMARGDITKKIEVREDDEIGDLGLSLNVMSQRLQENMNELQSYSAKIEEINAEINKKIVTLTNLYQIGNTMTTAAELENILQFILEKITQTVNTDKSFLAMASDDGQKFDIIATQNLEVENLEKVANEISSDMFRKLISENKMAVIDDHRKPPLGMRGFLFLSEYGMKNAVLEPIISRGAPVGILAIGNDLPSFVFEEDDFKIVNIFSRQIAIAIENEKLLRKTKKLITKDELTGLYNIQYINDRLGEEINRAIIYQRPCSLIMLAVNNYEEMIKNENRTSVEDAVKKLAVLLQRNAGLLDKIARFSESEFAIVLPEKNKGEACDMAEKIQAEVGMKAMSVGKSKVMVSIGVSSVPVDGVSGDELINNALASLNKAKEGGRGIVSGS